MEQIKISDLPGWAENGPKKSIENICPIHRDIDSDCDICNCEKNIIDQTADLCIGLDEEEFKKIAREADSSFHFRPGDLNRLTVLVAANPQRFLRIEKKGD